MAGKISSEMLKARGLIEKGATAYRAAKDTGLTTGAITRSKWYKDRVKVAAAPSPTEAARILITEQNYTAAEAAKRLAIAQSTIGRCQWYRDYIESTKGGKKR